MSRPPQWLAQLLLHPRALMGSPSRDALQHRYTWFGRDEWGTPLTSKSLGGYIGVVRAQGPTWLLHRFNLQGTGEHGELDSTVDPTGRPPYNTTG